MASDQIFCTACGAAFPRPARFCASCGSPRSQPDAAGNAELTQGQETFSSGLMAGLTGKPSVAADRAKVSRPEASANPDQMDGSSRRTGGRSTAIWVVAAVVAVGMFSLGMLDEPLRWLVSIFPGQLNLSVEITKGPDQGPAAKFGYITITNLGETLNLKSISVNHRKDAACLFGEGGTPIGTPTLEQGHSTGLSSLGLLLGGCGSILVVSVVTDRGSADYNIQWR